MKSWEQRFDSITLKYEARESWSQWPMLHYFIILSGAWCPGEYDLPFQFQRVSFHLVCFEPYSSMAEETNVQGGPVSHWVPRPVPRPMALSPVCPWVLIPQSFHWDLRGSQPLQADHALADATSRWSQEANCSLAWEVELNVKGLLRTVWFLAFAAKWNSQGSFKKVCGLGSISRDTDIIGLGVASASGLLKLPGWL